MENRLKLDKNDFITLNGVRCYRVVALEDFVVSTPEPKQIKAGDLGGYVSENTNINQDNSIFWIEPNSVALDCTFSRQTYINNATLINCITMGLTFIGSDKRVTIIHNCHMVSATIACSPGQINVYFYRAFITDENAWKIRRIDKTLRIEDKEIKATFCVYPSENGFRATWDPDPDHLPYSQELYACAETLIAEAIKKFSENELN